jgi:glycosyltransferase involved in cell wall biosynthesis
LKIAIDTSRAINEKAGVGKYTKNLIEHLLKIDKKNNYILLYNFWNNFEAKCKQAEKYKSSNTEIFCRRYPGLIKEHLSKTRVGFNKFLNKEADVYLAPTFLDFDMSLKIPQVVIIYDLAMFYYPEHLGEKLSQKFQKLTKITSEKANKIIAISESTKVDLIKILNINEEKIEVIYPGLNKFPKISCVLPSKIQQKSYILTVGTLEPRKNIKSLFKAYEMLEQKMQEQYPLVIVGAKGWNIDRDLQIIKQNKNIVFLDYVTDDALAKLYKEAKVFIYPSLYEGFGFPILEAMQFGTPVIASNISSIPEVGGEAVIYIDPKKPKTIYIIYKKCWKVILISKKQQS